MVIVTPEFCESCGKELDPLVPAKTLEDNFANDCRKDMGICSECFKKRFKIKRKKRSGYGGTIYELEDKGAPRVGIGSKSFTCLKCDWVAWTEEGLAAHFKKRHQPHE